MGSGNNLPSDPSHSLRNLARASCRLAAETDPGQALTHLLIIPADFFMGRSMCTGLKRRVEANARTPPLPSYLPPTARDPSINQPEATS